MSSEPEFWRQSVLAILLLKFMVLETKYNRNQLLLMIKTGFHTYTKIKFPISNIPMR